MEEFHELRQIGVGEIVGAHPGVEFFQAEVNRVRAVLDGGLGAIPIAGGREKFRQARRAPAFALLRRGKECEVRSFFRTTQVTLNCGQIGHDIRVAGDCC